MTDRFAVSSLLLLLVNGQRTSNVPSFMMGRPSEGLLNFALPKSVSVAADTLERFNITQQIDHWDLQKGTFQQRVQYNPAFYANNSLIFLMIGGENEANEGWVTHNVTYIQWAQKYGAAVFQLEHRFFGHSRPFNDLTVNSLKYLTMAQAIEDVATFIPLMNKKYGFEKPRWVTFGGSYPACLNSWFRMRHPELTVGAIASSAAINMKIDFFEYETVVENALNVTNHDCKERVGSAFQTIIAKTLTADGRRELSSKYSLNPPFDDTVTLLDLQNFIANMYGVFQGIVQYTYAHATSLNVSTLCDKINDPNVANDPLGQIREVMNWSNAFSSNGGFPNSYSDMIALYNQTSFDNMGAAAWRAWMWMSCNERGYMQTTDRGKNLFGNMIPLNYYMDMCTDLFGKDINAETVRKGNHDAKVAFPGSDKYDATNIVFVSGSLDPWSALGNYNSIPSKHISTIFIEGASHCADMYQNYDGEPPALAPARLQIEQELKYFIKTDVSSTTDTPSTTNTPKPGKNGAPMVTQHVLVLALLSAVLTAVLTL